MPDTIGDLARQDIYPDETGFQPPQNAVGGLTPEDWMMSGQQPPAATYDYVPPQSWLQKAGDLARRDVATYQQGGVPAMIGQLAEDSSGEQDLAGGFGGNIKGVEGKIGALADLAPHAPPFYSAVYNAVAGAKQTTAPGQQWAGFLRNQPGVKPEELNTLKLGDLFDQTAVTRQDLLDHIAANKVQLGEVRKADLLANDVGAQMIEPIGEHGLQYLRTSQDIADASRHNAQFRESIKGMSEDDILAAAERLREAQKYMPTKFSQYTLPGGENYREMLLTLPQKLPPEGHSIVQRPDGAWSLQNAEGQQITQRADRATLEAAIQANPGWFPSYRSSHFDEPNILAHVRYNDRVIDGKKTLFVEEVQSDWHQKGKREGYGLQITPEAESLMPEIRKLGISEDPNNISSKMITDAGGDYDLATKWWNLVHDRQVVVSKGPPDAPFKTTWPDLAMKRVIREAAEKGYDKVAWTPGSVQADRYDLSKQVNQLDLTHNRDGVGKLGMTLKDGSRQYVDITSKENLADTVGKDVADKLYKQGAENNGIAVLSGLDLKIGGEGMKGFYDQILPAAVNKIVKKAGGRVGQGEIQGSGPDLIEEGRGNYRKPRPDETDTYKVHTLDITPQLREMALKKGFPLFTAGGLVAGGAISGSKMGDLAKQDDYQ
jgi:hypothetical protein